MASTEIACFDSPLQNFTVLTGDPQCCDCDAIEDETEKGEER